MSYVTHNSQPVTNKYRHEQPPACAAVLLRRSKREMNIDIQ
jgi:hypothetical protein